MAELSPVFRSRLARRAQKTSHNFQHTKSTTARGYGADWRRRRKRVLERDAYTCQPHLRQGLYRKADDVDHVVSKAEAARMGWTEEQIEDDSNLQAICRQCHKHKTATERGRGGSKSPG